MPHEEPNLTTLPSEIRLKMYQRVSPPLKSPISDYQGMLPANKSLLLEAEPDLAKQMRQFL